MNRRAQVSMEYLAIFAFAVLLIIPLILLFSVQTQNLQSDVANAQVYKILTKISDSAEDIYFQGEPAKKTIRVSFPEGIESVIVNESYVAAYFYADGGIISATKTSSAVMSGSIRHFAGDHTITFTANGSHVILEDK